MVYGFYYSLFIKHAASVFIVGAHRLVSHRCHVSWVSPDGVPHILLVRNCVFDRVLDIRWILAQSLVVTLLWKATDLEWTKLWWLWLHAELFAELPIAAIGLSEWVKWTMLVH